MRKVKETEIKKQKYKGIKMKTEKILQKGVAFWELIVKAQISNLL